MALYLNVPYEQKDLARTLGAKWDRIRKQWYVVNKYDYYKFLDWIPWIDRYCSLVCDGLYIVEAPCKCFKCKKETRVVSLAYKEHFLITKDKDGNLIDYQYEDECLKFFTLDDEIENIQLRLFLKNKFRYYYSYSKFIKDLYVANHCEHCGKIQGNFYLHDEPDGPFGDYIEYENKKNYKLYKVPLSEDGVAFPDYTYSGFSPDENMDIKTFDSLTVKPIEI